MNSPDLVTINPDILGGTSVFKNTRVPVKTLFASSFKLWTAKERGK